MKKILALIKDLDRTHGRNLDRWWVGYLICLIGFGITILAFYPGYMTPDSIANLTSGREGVFYDINSPVMSWLWGVIDGFYPGPGPMLLLHNLIFWSAGAIFWRAARDRSAKLGICLVLIGFLPQVLSQLSTVWKDVGLAACLFLTASILFHAVQKRSKVLLALTPVLLFYAYTARLNSFPAIVPFAIWTGLVVSTVFNLDLKSWKKGVFVSLFAALYFLALTAAVLFVNDRLTEGRTVYPFQQVYLYDLAAISKGRDEALFPDYVLSGENFSLENVRNEYDLRSINRLIYGNRPSTGDPPILDLTRDPAEIASLQRTWKKVVWDNKGLYLRHRFEVFAQLVGFTRQTVTIPFWDPGFRDNPAEFRSEPNLLNAILMKYFSLFRKHVFFTGFIWLLLCVFFMYKAVRNEFRAEWQVVFFLSLSAVLYAMAYFPTTPSTEFRYIFWSELAAAAAAVLSSYLLLRKRSDAKQNVTETVQL